MVRILVLKYLNQLSDEQVEYQLLDRMSYQRFCLLEDSATIPDRNTVWHYQQRLGADGVTALFQAVDGQLLGHGFIARCGQIIDATLVPAPIQHFTKDEKEQLAQGKTPRTGAMPSAGKRPGRHPYQETRQELPRLQAEHQCRRQAQVHPQDRHRHGQRARQQALR
jgi:IS5 family transposase